MNFLIKDFSIRISPHYSRLNNFQFKELPELLLQHDSLVVNFNNQLFSGDAAKILVNL